MICGNHDSYYKNTNEVNSLSIMEKFDNIKIYIEPVIINNRIVLVPWGCDYREYDVPICMGHFDIKDFQLNDNSISKSGEDPKNFKKFDLVLSGHFHKYSEKNNIKYIGNMYGHNFNDINAQRGL
jgi:DNA repair exonuclease SbcCD nuclease subunit